jgi:hypothetical protein
MLTNIVMMGMGEPLYNFDNVRDALKIVMDGDGLGLSRRRITLSTSGVVPMMARAGKEIGVNLAVSLHAVSKEIRDEIVPLNRKYGIEQLLEACERQRRACARTGAADPSLPPAGEGQFDSVQPMAGGAVRVLGRRADPGIQQHYLRGRHLGAGAHPSRP